jgi:glycosyltransferase involved in cell wall biosynthesis
VDGRLYWAAAILEALPASARQRRAAEFCVTDSTTDATPAPLLSVVIPAFNERATIDALLAAVLAVAVEKEVIIVDDYSTDGTRERLQELAADNDHIRVILHDVNRGKGAASRTGFAHARGRFVVVQDADLEYDPADYSKLLQPLLDDTADVVYGSRFLGSEIQRVPYYWHTLGNRFLTLISNMLTNLQLTDMETCYKVVRRDVLQNIHLQEDRFGFEPEITAKLAAYRHNGQPLRIYEVGVSYQGRTFAEGKKISWRDGVRALWCIFKYNWFR